jgi:hypothetical protein
MNTIDYNVLVAAAEVVHEYQKAGGMSLVFSVTIELNGSHGGADVRVLGATGTDVQRFNMVTLVLT